MQEGARQVMSDHHSAPAFIDPVGRQPRKWLADLDSKMSYIELGQGGPPYARREDRFPTLGWPVDCPRGRGWGQFCKSLIGFWWNNARDRRRLRACGCIDSRFAKDIGMTAEQLVHECQGPFWVPVPRIGADMFHLHFQANRRV
jgi:hypothetical protein